MKLQVHCYKVHSREIAILNFQRTLGELCLEYDDEYILHLYNLYESVFLTERGMFLVLYYQLYAAFFLLF